MSKKNIDDFLQEGMYGKKEIKPEERRRFLGTLRERIILAITYSEIMKNKGHHQLEQLMKIHPNGTLLLNGHISYDIMKDYKLLAEKNKINYTFVTMKNVKTDIGAVFTYDHAIEKENIFLSDMEIIDEKPIPISKDKKSRISSFIDSLLQDFKEK